MDKIKLQLNKLTSEVKDLKKENKELLSKITKLEKRIPSPESIDIRPAQEIYDEAYKIVIKSGKVSTSYLQRMMGIGYARAACLIDMLEEKGVISEARGANPRKVLIK